MQNKTPILVLTGLAIVAAAAIAGLTRDQWMGGKPQTVATAPEAPKTAEQPATTAPASSGEAQTTAPAASTTAQTAAPAAPATAEQPAAQATAEQPASTATQPAQQATAAAPAQTAATQPVTPSEQPAATNAAPQPTVPTFDTVRVEKTGEAVIAGRAGAGADVVVKLDGQAIGKSTANEDGAFVVVPEKPLPAGSGALTVEAKGKGDLNPTASQQSVAVIVPTGGQQEALVAVVSPDQPTRVLQKPAAPQAPAAEKPAEKPAKLVSIDAVDYDSAGNIVFSGQGEQGNTARIYIDNNIVGDAAVGADGHWTFSGTADVKPGVHTLRVDGLDSAGKVLNRVEVPFFREQQNKVADAAQATQPTQQPAPATTTTTTTTTTADTSAQTQAAQPAQTQETTEKAVDTEAATAPADAAAPAKPKEGRVVIQPGNNLWRISRVLYGAGNKYTMLYKANKDQIRNPNLIYPGQIFKTPEIAAKAESVDPHRRAPLTDEEHTHTAQ